MTEITLQHSKAIAQAWKDRADAQGYKEGTRTYAKLELEFMCGAIAAVQVLGGTYPPVWELLIQSGRSVSGTYLPKAEEAARPATHGKDQP